MGRTKKAIAKRGEGKKAVQVPSVPRAGKRKTAATASARRAAKAGKESGNKGPGRNARDGDDLDKDSDVEGGTELRLIPTYVPTPTKGRRQTFGECCLGKVCSMWDVPAEHQCTQHYCVGCHGAMHSNPSCDFAFAFRQSVEVTSAPMEAAITAERIHLCSEACAHSYLSRVQKTSEEDELELGVVLLRQFMFRRFTEGQGGELSGLGAGVEATPPDLVSGQAFAGSYSHPDDNLFGGCGIKAPNFDVVDEDDGTLDDEDEVDREEEKDDFGADLDTGSGANVIASTAPGMPAAKAKTQKSNGSFLSRKGTRIEFENIPGMDAAIVKSALSCKAVKPAHGTTTEVWDDVRDAVVRQFSNGRYAEVVALLEKNNRKIRDRFESLMKGLPKLEGLVGRTGSGGISDFNQAVVTGLREATAIRQAAIEASTAEKAEQDRKTKAGQMCVAAALRSCRGLPNVRKGDIDAAVQREAQDTRTRRSLASPASQEDRLVESDDDDDEPTGETGLDGVVPTGKARTRETTQSALANLQVSMDAGDAARDDEAERDAGFTLAIEGALEKVSASAAASNLASVEALGKVLVRAVGDGGNAAESEEKLLALRNELEELRGEVSEVKETSKSTATDVAAILAAVNKMSK